MRYAIAIGLLLFVGMGIGAAASIQDIRRISFSPAQLVTPESPAAVRANPAYNAGLPHPRAIADALTYDFGKMERGARLSHSFQITNKGQLPLTLEKGETSCKCTVSGLDKNALSPGETAAVTLEWVADTDLSVFRQTATISTNDPGRPRLEFEVTGRIIQAVRLAPEILTLTKIANEEKTYPIRMTSIDFDGLQVLSSAFENQETAQFYEVSYRPLTAEELRVPDVTGLEPKSGALLTVTLKPGLPLGPIRQKILLVTNSPENPKVSLPVTGMIEGDISVAGRGWNRTQNALDLGVLPSAAGAERELMLLVRGPHRDQVKFDILKKEPEALQARLGESTELAGRVRRIPLLITIPKNLPTMSFLGSEPQDSGKIVLGTTHPDVPEMTIRIKFAIED